MRTRLVGIKKGKQVNISYAFGHLCNPKIKLVGASYKWATSLHTRKIGSGIFSSGSIST